MSIVNTGINLTIRELRGLKVTDTAILDLLQTKQERSIVGETLGKVKNGVHAVASRVESATRTT